MSSKQLSVTPTNATAYRPTFCHCATDRSLTISTENRSCTHKVGTAQSDGNLLADPSDCG